MSSMSQESGVRSQESGVRRLGKKGRLTQSPVNTVWLSPKQRNNVGWVERRETQQTLVNVGFRSSTQPTKIFKQSPVTAQ